MKRLLLSLFVAFTLMNVQAQVLNLLELESAVVDFLQTDTESEAETFRQD